MAEVDDWTSVGQRDDWGPVSGTLPEPLPDSFLHRLAVGSAVTDLANASPEQVRKGQDQILGLPPIEQYKTDVIKQFKAGLDRVKEGFANGHDLGLAQPYEMGKGALTAASSPIAPFLKAIGRGGELASGGLLTSEDINNALMLGMPKGSPGAVFSRLRNGVQQDIGGLPKPEDFQAGAQTLDSDAAETNLRTLWQERGIHPAEAVHDAQSDGFLRQDIAPPSFAVYHGSPHEFERFDISRIGTGEGAQAYGHGLYFAENPEVAGTYREGVMPPNSPAGIARARFDDLGGRDEAVRSLKEGLEFETNPEIIENKKRAIELLGDKSFDPSGQLYRVRINADRESFLDLDKALDEQTPQVQAALKQAMGANWEEFKGSQAATAIKQGFIAFSDEQVATKLRDAGIPGIKYLDQGSRGVGEGSRNFVLFDDGLAQITHKNGVPLTPTKIEHPTNTPISAGTPRSQLALTGDPLVDRVIQSATVRRVLDNPVIDDTHEIPNSWGGSVPIENPVTYRDKDFPKFLTVDGVTHNTAEPAAIHENVEEAVDTRLQKGGMSRDAALRAAYWGWGNPAEHAWYRAHGMDSDHVEAALKPFLDQIASRKADLANIPRDLFLETYPNGDPLEDVAGEIEKPSEAEMAQARAIMEEAIAAGEFRPAGADVTRPENLPTMAQQAPAVPGSLAERAKAAVGQLTDLANGLREIVDPMSVGSDRAMVIAKDAMNSVRRIRWEYARAVHEVDTSPALKAARDRLGETAIQQRERMWNAADEESVLRQEGQASEHMGLVTLEPEEREFVERMQERGQAAWLHMVDAGGVEGEGLPAYTPRMVLNVALAGDSLAPRALNELGRNVFTRTAQMMHREYLTAEETETAARAAVRARMTKAGATPEAIEEAAGKVKIFRDIRALPLAAARLEEAAVWREMIENVRRVGKAVGTDTVAEEPLAKDWFTIAGNPAFKTWGPKFETNPVTGAMEAARTESGDVIMAPKPLYMSGEFRGPMNAILDPVKGAFDTYAYGPLMALKGKAMTVILNSPLVHNGVVLSKVLETTGGVAPYWRGNKIVNGNPARTAELIERGLNPMGPRGPIQDITSMAEEPNMVPGRSLTAKLVGAVPGIWSPEAEVATRAAIDKLGDFWHNTLLWDRVRDLQFGMADYLSDHLVEKGLDRLTADRISTHFSNMVVGSIPKEAMSRGATAIANLALFSRSFTLGNLSVFKMAAGGLPKPLLAQIERDFLAGAAGEEAPEAAALTKQVVQGMARRKAISAIALSVGMYYVGNAVIQHAFNFLHGSNLDAEREGYVRRFQDLFASGDKYNPLTWISRLSPTYDNEPAHQDRAHVGYDRDGTAIYARNVFGKYGEELLGYPSMLPTMLRRKESPVVAWLHDWLANDDGTGHKLFDERDTSFPGYVDMGAAVAKHLVARHLPSGQLEGLMDTIQGQGDPTVNAMRLVGPMAGFTTSKGAPGGEQKGEAFSAQEDYKARFAVAWPGIKKQIQNGDIEGAQKGFAQVGTPPKLQQWYIRNIGNPSLPMSGRATQRFREIATPEQIERFERAGQRQQ